MAYTTIKKPSDYFNTKLYTGNGSTQNITGVGFQPDLIWLKDRDATDWHWWNDAVRGATKTIFSNVTNAESTQATSITAFDTDGFTLGNDGSVNRNNDNYVAWNWLGANGTASNTDGSITSTVSANTTSGFSIVSYTGNATDGATVGHGLGAVPDMLIGKDLSDGSGWGIWHKDLTNAGYKLSFTTDAQADDSALFGGSSRTAPTSSVFTLGSGGGLNGSNANIIYAFTSIKGFSKFGSYTGNGNANGTFVYTGFKPAFVMIKHTNGTSNWTINDTGRDPTNVNNLRLFPNQNVAESSGSDSMDMLSNGFKFRSTDGGNNGSGDTYIFMAFAAEPLVANVSSSIPATAR